MTYIYTIDKNGEILEYDLYSPKFSDEGEQLEEQLPGNQTLVQYQNNFIVPKFDFEKNEWFEGFEKRKKEKTEEELLQEQIEKTKRKIVTEFELRKALAEEQRNNMKMMMMMLAKK